MQGSAPTGLYGWIRSNDGRSLGLFLAFLLAVQVIAVPVMFFPLVFVDQFHAPFLNTSGYLARYVPLVAIASVIWFGAKYFWHIETVRRAVGFRFIDDREEPYLCSVIEPLITMWGLPVPFVGMIEDNARNAFACGIGRKKAVVVVTRGLIEDLTREELECVLAHELSHIKNNDIRLMAAANIFMSALARMKIGNPMQVTPVHALMALAVPAMLPLSLLGSFLGAAAMRAGQMSRLLIASRREFIADAEAVTLTKNPGAMASALVKVEHAYRIKGARNEDDAMMIAGDTEGNNATHPTVAQRIAALARTTGSMVFNSHSSPVAAAFESNPSLSEAQESALLRSLPATRALPRIRAKSNTNWLGLDRMGSLSAGLAVVALAAVHWAEIEQPRIMLAKFDVRPIGLIMGRPLTCDIGFDDADLCSKSREADYAAFEGQKNTLAGWLVEKRKRTKAEGGNADAFMGGSSTFKSMKMVEATGSSGRLKPIRIEVETGRSRSEDVRTRIAEADEVGCFGGYSVPDDNPEGKYGLGQPSSAGSYERMFSSAADSANVIVIKGGAITEDVVLEKYVGLRKSLLVGLAYNMYGLPGLRALQSTYQDAPHAVMLQRLSERFADPRFAGRFDAAEQAEIRALIRNPRAFVPCIALRHLPPDQSII